IGMDGSNIANLRRIAPSPEAEKKIHAMAEYFNPSTRWDHVPDPYYEGAEGFELVLDLLEEGCQNLLNQITTEK
ncbi:MAG: low molecular weight phosphotyrosine protein phosphatase, partial [Duncaniella sp.]|nr:low molecular weight phosphotyrosine protein phosphatase [Duncaniella sp.]